MACEIQYLDLDGWSLESCQLNTLLGQVNVYDI
jgi:hypothetical protein